MIKINFDPSVLTTQRNLSYATSRLNTTLQRMSTGFRINSAADDPAGLYIASGMYNEMTSLAQIQKNILEGISFITMATGAMGNMTDILNRLRDLTVQTSSSTYSADQKDATQREIDALIKELYNLKNGTSFNGINIFGDVENYISNTGDTTVSHTAPPPQPWKTAQRVHLHQLKQQSPDYKDKKQI